MRTRIIYFAGATVIAFVIGFTSSRIPSSGQATKHFHSLKHEGAQLRDALLRLDPPPVQVEAPVKLPDWVMKPVREHAVATPPKPVFDVALAFRKDITAVVKTSAGYSAWVIDPGAPHGQRVLKIGDAYREGWRVTALRGDRVTLKRRGETQDVALNTFAPVKAIERAGPATSSTIRAIPPTEWPKGDPRSMAPSRFSERRRAL